MHAPPTVTRNGGRPEVEGPLSWLTGILWPDPGSVRAVLNSGLPGGFRPLERYGVLPSAREPRLLIPLSSRKAAAASLRQSNNSMTQSSRLTRWVASAGVGTGMAQGLVRDRLTVGIRRALPPESVPRAVLDAHLKEQLGIEDLRLAILPGRPTRPNRKPVLELVTGAGSLVGYAKVGWNGLTRGLVRNETRVLRRWAERPPVTFDVPTLLHAGRWRDLEVIVISATPARVWRRGRLNAAPPRAVALEVAALGGTSRSSLGESGYWEGTRDRARFVRDAAATGAAALDAINRAEADWGDAVLTFGTSHGDWAPWNMEWGTNRLFVWDWERCRDHVPLGFDVVHFLVQTALRRRVTSRAVESSLRASPPELAAIGVDPGLAPILHRVYLIELLLRYEEGGEALDPRVRAAVGNEMVECLEASW